MKACHTCLQILREDTFLISTRDFYSDETPDQDPFPLKDKLAYCVPEFFLGSDPNTFLSLCKPCATAINGAHKFKQKCLETQSKIHTYIEQLPVKTEFNIEDAARHYRRLEIVTAGGDPTEIDEEREDVSNRLIVVKQEPLSSPNDRNEACQMGQDSAVDLKQELISDDEGEVEEVPLTSTTVKEDVIELIEPELNTQEIYKCMLCKNLISSYSRFCYHMLLHNNQNRGNKCSECAFTYSINKELVMHMKRHKINCNEVCHLCGDRFPDKTTLRIHMQIHANLGLPMVRCKFCNFYFEDPTSLSLHLELHDENCRFKCDVCLLKFPSRRTLKHHIWVSCRSQHKDLKMKRKKAPRRGAPFWSSFDPRYHAHGEFTY